MPTTRERYDEMTKTLVGDELRTVGFNRRRNAFFRKTAQGWSLIDFQASQFGTRDEVSFTINLAVSFAELQAADEGPPSLGRAHIRQRIGHLLHAGEDTWWNLNPDSDFEAVAVEVNGALQLQAIPWLANRVGLAELLAAARADHAFIESWHLARLGMLAERAEQPRLAEELVQLSQRP